MTNIISTIIFAVVGTASLNIFEIEGIFSNAHVNAIEEHIQENKYTDDDLLILQYSSKEGSEESFKKLNNLLSKYDFPIGIWFGPYQISVNYDLLKNLDFIGFSPGIEIYNVPFEEIAKEKYCTINLCNFEEGKIVISTNEGIYDNYLIVGTLGSFIENIDFYVSDQSIEFFKPSLFERFYISISNPIFTYLFFVLGFALIGLELFAIGPGLMAVVGSLLVISSTLPFQEFGINYFGIFIFFVSFLMYIKILSRGYFSSLGVVAFLVLFCSSLVMFSEYEVSINFILLFFVSVALALFYFVAIPTVIRSRLTTDTSGGTSLIDQSCKLIEILESDTGLVKYKNTELRVYLETDKYYKKRQDYVFFEKDGNLFI
tara:strand:+ start:376 stop:1494 length:1119 start_codon:yes stop_codon:yes gene_type:complete